MFDPKSQDFHTLTSSNENINHLGIRNFSARVKLSATNYENYKSVKDSNIQFRTQNTNTEFDACSPPLWKSTTMIDHENLSPNSRTRIIAKAQRELMDIAKGMPESCYELSLRDIVEKPIIHSPKLDDETRCLFDEKNIEFERKKSVKKIIKQESKKIEKRVERVKSDNFGKGGTFLKMVFLISIRSKRKKNVTIRSNSKRVSPKVEPLSKSLSSEKEPSKKKKLGSSGNKSVENGVISGSKKDSKSKIDSNGDGCRIVRNNVRVSSGCFSFALSTKNKRKSK